MHRNLSERVEAAVPIYDRKLRTRLWEILQVCLADHRNAWELQPDGGYLQLMPESDTSTGSAGTHTTMMQLALARHGL
jgi:polyphosphate kinase